MLEILFTFDPPYTVMHNNNNFLKYNSSLFSWEDQIRLAAAIKRATKRGASIMLSNADHQSVKGLYKGFGYHRSVKRASILAAEPQHRRQTTELIITIPGGWPTLSFWNLDSSKVGAPSFAATPGSPASGRGSLGWSSEGWASHSARSYSARVRNVTDNLPMPFARLHFEFDPAKAASNRKKHGVSFDEAVTVLQRIPSAPPCRTTSTPKTKPDSSSSDDLQSNVSSSSFTLRLHANPAHRGPTRHRSRERTI